MKLKKQCDRCGGAADSIQALYEYKDFLEEQDAQEARWVLVDACETLELYKTALPCAVLRVGRNGNVRRLFCRLIPRDL